MTDYDVIGAMCLFWFAVGWSIGRFCKEKAKDRRFKRMIRRRK